MAIIPFYRLETEAQRGCNLLKGTQLISDRAGFQIQVHLIPKGESKKKIAIIFLSFYYVPGTALSALYVFSQTFKQIDKVDFILLLRSLQHGGVK